MRLTVRAIGVQQHPVSTLPIFDMPYFTDPFVQHEPVLEQVKDMITMFTLLGTLRGKPFEVEQSTEVVLLEDQNFTRNRMP